MGGRHDLAHVVWVGVHCEHLDVFRLTWEIQTSTDTVRVINIMTN